MLSNMETERSSDQGGATVPSIQQARQQLAEAERAEATVWTTYPELGWAYPPVFGLWFGALVAIQSVESNVLSILGLVALLGLMGGAFRWYVNKRGAMPRGLRSAPAELRRPMIAYLVAAGVTAAIMLALSAMVGWVSAAVFVTIAATIILAVFDRSYAKAAKAATRRLDAAAGYRA